MSRYIDVDALMKRIEDSNKSAGLHLEDLRKIRRWIKTAPSIDIVGCKECKYAEDCEQMVVFENGKYITSGYKLDFCSYGERSE